MTSQISREIESNREKDAAGTLRGTRFARKFSKTNEPISIETVFAIHKSMFEDWWPEIAGKIRQENVDISGSSHKPPHYKKLDHHIKELELDIVDKLQNIRPLRGTEDTKENIDTFSEILQFAAWIQHKIVWIHPFREGNGRVARLMSNIVLLRSDLYAIDCQIKRDNKNQYCNALAQIDNHNDYEPLIEIMVEELISLFGKEGVSKLW